MDQLIKIGRYNISICSTDAGIKSLFFHYRLNVIDENNYNILDPNDKVIAALKGNIRQAIAELSLSTSNVFYIKIEHSNDNYGIQIMTTQQTPANEKASPEIKGSLPFYRNPLFKGAVVCICVASIIAGIMHQFNYSSAEFTQYMNKILSGRFAR